MSKIASHDALVNEIANLLREFDAERPVHGRYQPGIGPFTETKLVREIASRLRNMGLPAETKQTPDMVIGDEWGIEFKIARPFGDNGKEAEHWSQNLTHPYKGNVSLIGDAFKLRELSSVARKCVFAIGFEHTTPQIPLEPLFAAFEMLSQSLLGIPLGNRIQAKRTGLVHPVHQTLSCVSWEVFDNAVAPNRQITTN